MIAYEEVKQTVMSLIEDTPILGLERLPTATRDYHRLIPKILSEVRAFTVSPEESRRHNQDFRIAILRIASIECAAGASVERCRTWFYCLASLAAWTPMGNTQPIDIGEAAIWAALAGQFQNPILTAWTEDPDTRAITDRVVYRLLTRKPIDVQSPHSLFEDQFWQNLCSAMENGQSEPTTFAFQAIANWWLSEYENTETPAYDPEQFSTFEPAPNAALAIALIRDQMAIQFHQSDHRRFYYAALMLAQCDRSSP